MEEMVSKVLLVTLMLSNADGNSQLDGAELIQHRSLSLHRVRRTVLNSSEMQEVLTVHNQVRQEEGSSDMQIMVWKRSLATMADGWAQRCQWYHNTTISDPNSVSYQYMGQNLYAISGVSSINITSAVLAWYNEKPYYSYTTLKCESGQQCGHYTQVVWANSYEIGCAYVKCPTLYQSDLKNAFYLVCNYGPAGNILNEKPYQQGSACTKCSSGSSWCNQNLCDNSCTQSSPNCRCTPYCYNGGYVDRAACSCQCTPGWYGTDCSQKSASGSMPGPKVIGASSIRTSIAIVCLIVFSFYGGI